MLELPEAYTIGRQLQEAIVGKTIASAVANSSPHGFAWYFGDPAEYGDRLSGETVKACFGVGGQVQIDTGAQTMLFADGVNLRLHQPGGKLPAKHQIMVEFADGYALSGSVQMYGGIWAYAAGTNENSYYHVACEKPSPLTDAFDEAHFMKIVSEAKPSLSAKALLATEQRIPGLGNGVLQDILFISGIHPKTPIRALSDAELHTLFMTVKATLRQMAEQGGRDTEKDIYGNEGGYRTLLSRKTLEYPCKKCGGALLRKAYLGGNVYFCETCQPARK